MHTKRDFENGIEALLLSRSSCVQGKPVEHNTEYALCLAVLLLLCGLPIFKNSFVRDSL